MHPDTYPPPAQADPALASLWEAMLRAYRDMQIAEQRGLNVTARDRLLAKYLQTYRAYCDAEQQAARHGS